MPLKEDEYYDYLDKVPEAPDFFAILDLAPTPELRSKLDAFHDAAKAVLVDYEGHPPMQDDTAQRLHDLLEEADELAGELSEIEEQCASIRSLLEQLGRGVPDSLYEDS